jgi:hypothetical protein
MANVWTQFKKLLPSDAILAGQVTAHNTDGTSTITLPDGSQIKALGTSVTVGQRAFVRAGEVLGPAPGLPIYDIEV